MVEAAPAVAYPDRRSWCAVSGYTRDLDGVRTRAGKGPVWPVLAFPQLSFSYPVWPEQIYYPSDWSGNKVLWVARRYRGPVLIRGAQLNGPNELRFGLSRVPVREMRLSSVGGRSPDGWQNRPFGA